MTKPRFEPPVLRWNGVVVALALAGLGLGPWVMSMGGLAATLVAEALILAAFPIFVLARTRDGRAGP